MPQFIDLTGMEFNGVKIISMDKREKNNITWNCKCHCGNEFVTRGQGLKSGHCTSCGCYKDKVLMDRIFKHGLSVKYRRLYKIWEEMIRRCTNPSHTSYERYGGRGICVCNEWMDAPTFVEWSLSNGYEEHLSIDRINNDGNYEPTNCRWTTFLTQMRNTRRSIGIEKVSEIKAKLKSGISKYDLAKEYGVHYSAICKIGRGATYSDII